MDTKKRFVKNISVLISLILAFVLLVGCVGFLDAYTERITPHEAPPYIPQPTEQIVVSTYDEFVSVILQLIMGHEREAQIQFHYHDDDDIQNEIERARNEILNEHPIGAFALADITMEAARIVTHYEIDVVIDYTRTEEEINSITNIVTQHHIMTHLLSIMSGYNSETVIRTRLPITVYDINSFVRDVYYQNPRRIVMLPFVSVEVYPQDAYSQDAYSHVGADRIFEIHFEYTAVNANMLPDMSDELAYNIQRSAELVDGSTDSERLLSLVNVLIESVAFDDAAPVHSHGAQNWAATAFGALIHGSAVGEGFAMAFQAIADELGLDSRIVLGYFEGRVHAWNIVYLYGYFYHIDVAMARVNGIETAILKRDVDFEEMRYEWDRENTVRCEGELTLEDIMDPLIYDEPDDIDENGESNNEDEG